MARHAHPWYGVRVTRCTLLRIPITSLAHDIRPADPWATDVLPHLPVDLDAQARALGAVQRHRAFATPSDLLRGLLVYALAQRSLAQPGAWGVRTDVAAPVRPRWLAQRVRGRVLLVDATTLGLAQGRGDAWRLHLAYDLLAGQLDQLRRTARTGAEGLHHFRFQPGDLVVTDSGYGRSVGLAHAHQQGAAVALRVYLPNFPLQQPDGQPLALLPWLQRAGAQTTTRSTIADVVHAGQRIRVRVIAARLPRDQQGVALRRSAYESLCQYASEVGIEFPLPV